VTEVRTIAPFVDEMTAKEETQNRKQRIYANATKLRHFALPTTKDELFTPASDVKQDRYTVWISAPFRATVLASAYAAYPSIIAAARTLLTDTMRDDAAPLTGNFLPAVSLLYGAWLSITFSVLEERVASLQRTATEESALLTALCRRTALIVTHDLELTSESRLLAHEAVDREDVECVFAPIFEQTTTLASRSREEEILLVANDCVYRRFEVALRQLVARTTTTTAQCGDPGAAAGPAPGGLSQTSFRPSQLDGVSDLVDKLVVLRAARLSKETRALPPAHFVILSVFSFQLLLCFIYAVATSATPVDDPILRVAFSFFFSVYLLVFNFALDLNDPFRGNYQIRRSAINGNLLATRRLVASIVGDDVATRWDRDGV